MRPPERGEHDDPMGGAAQDFVSEPVFICSTCSRTDLPETGGWDPPICQECDAAINFDTLAEEI